MSQAGHEVVAMGASWGGLDALRAILSALPGDFGAAVVVAQHRSADSHPTMFRDLLGAVTRLKVCEADDKDELRPGTVFVAAADYHLLVEPGRLALSLDERVQFARPSVDVLLASAAESYRERCVGVVLTGANEDGAHGLARVAELGGAAIVQDPATAERDEMPRAAIAAVPAARVAGLDEIPRLLIELCGPQKVAA